MPEIAQSETQYRPPKQDKLGSQFEVQRQRLKQGGETERRQRLEAHQRRAAQLQGGPSGFSIHANERLENDLAHEQQSGLSDINAQEMQLRYDKEQAKKARRFQTSERLGGQEFARGERIGQQEFGRGERLGAQEFGRSERLGGQEHQSAEAQKLMNFQQTVQQFYEKSKLRELDQFDKQFNEDVRTTEFNKFTALMADPDWAGRNQKLAALANDPTTSKTTRDMIINFILSSSSGEKNPSNLLEGDLPARAPRPGQNEEQQRLQEEAINRAIEKALERERLNFPNGGFHRGGGGGGGHHGSTSGGGGGGGRTGSPSGGNAHGGFGRG